MDTAAWAAGVWLTGAWLEGSWGDAVVEPPAVSPGVGGAGNWGATHRAIEAARQSSAWVVARQEEDEVVLALIAAFYELY